MTRKPITDMSAWPSLSLEGNLIAPAMIAKINQRTTSEQAPENYSVRKGMTIREEISIDFRVGQSHFDAFTKLDTPSQDATNRFISGLFKETFGFDDLELTETPVTLLASGRVPIVIVPPSEILDQRSPTLSIDRSRSPAFALQDYLNDKEESLWGIATNGINLRLMRHNASLTRPAYIEANLTHIFSNEDISSFGILWLLIHRSRFGAEGTPATDCALERWRDIGSREGEVARDRLAGQVQAALGILGSGFLKSNPLLATNLKSGTVDLTDWFNELLRLVYRLIFLMVAEDRNHLHPEKSKAEPRTLYAQGYSLVTLRKQCYQNTTWDKHHDRYEGIKVVFHALARGEDALALPALGGLFADDQLPHLGTASLRNSAFMKALYRLSWLSNKTGLVPINWREMETEELGSVYESLLELQPQLGDDGKTLILVSKAAKTEKRDSVYESILELQPQLGNDDKTLTSAEQKSNQRKTSGSYYTPDRLVQALLDTALDPVLDKIEAKADDPAKALLKLAVIDPACGSGHFLLAAARRIATRLARIQADGTPSLADFRHALRDVARCCIHGVDRNPMAVELTKVALWIETVDPGLPLGFFDAQILCGDALLGVFDLKVLNNGIPDAAYKPLTRDDKVVAKYYERTNKAMKSGQGIFDFTDGRSTMPIAPNSVELAHIRAKPENTVGDVEAKEKANRALRKQEPFIRARMGCNLFTAAFLLPKIGKIPNSDNDHTVPTSEDIWYANEHGKYLNTVMQSAEASSIKARAFHWPLEFPDIIERGGFDVILGNPPYGRLNNIPEANRLFLKEREGNRVDASNIANYFISLGIDCLRQNGVIGLVVPKAITYSNSYAPTRKTIASNSSLTWVIDLGSAFDGVSLEQIIFVCEKTKRSLALVHVGRMNGSEIELGECVEWNALEQETIWPIYLFGKRLALARKIQTFGEQLASLATKSGKGGIFRGLPLQGQKSLHFDKPTEEMCPILRGRNLTHYTIWLSSDEKIVYVNPNELPSKYKNAIKRQQKMRIGAGRISVKIEATLLSEQTLTFDTVINILLNDWSEDFAYYLIGWLNSDLAAWYMKWGIFNNAVLSIGLDSDYIGRLPVPPWNSEEWQLDVSRNVKMLLSQEVRKYRRGNTNYRNIKGASHSEINNLFRIHLGITEDEAKFLDNLSIEDKDTDD